MSLPSHSLSLAPKFRNKTKQGKETNIILHKNPSTILSLEVENADPGPFILALADFAFTVEILDRLGERLDHVQM